MTDKENYTRKLHYSSKKNNVNLTISIDKDILEKYRMIVGKRVGIRRGALGYQIQKLMEKDMEDSI